MAARAKKDGRATKYQIMKNPTRNLLILLHGQPMSEQAIEQEVDNLNTLLIITESTERFCSAHELVNRNRITSSKSKILKESRYTELRPFRFLINKN